jgi:phosphoribosylformimino-5-aminoimidazole carboxamide ribotide isomerase
MEIIPVIDLLHGQVVRAQRGQRGNYQPMSSPLCTSSKPREVAHALLELYPFRSLYIADLDAILGTGDSFDIVAELHEHFPGIDLWLDAGMHQPQQVNRVMELQIKPVIGSERLETIDQYTRLREALYPEDMLLSLDFNADGFMGSTDLHTQPEIWPQQVICMTLAQVGSYSGPDFATLNSLITRAGQRQVIAAGGIRDPQDISRLQELGVAGALVASALHDGKISTSQLAEFMQ